MPKKDKDHMPVRRGMRMRSTSRVPTTIVIQSTLSITSGTFQMTAIVKDQTGTTMAGTLPDAWHSSNTAAVTVSSTGLVTFVAVGSSNVTASLTTPGGTITSNTCAVTATTGTNFVRSDFSSGSYSPQFYDPFGASRWTIIDDPTGSGRGKIAKVIYVTDGVVQTDDNQALLPAPGTFTITLGQEVWFQGDFYIDPAGRMDPTGPNLVQRKLFRWGNDDRVTIPSIEFELSSFGPQLAYVFQPSQAWSNNPPLEYIDPAVVSVTAGAWHTLKARMKVNSAFGVADGIAQGWFDNVLILDQHAVEWSDASWIGPYNPANYRFDDFGFGDQVSASAAVSEYRYWDNVSYATTEGAL
jgi:hypothetical protein